MLLLVLAVIPPLVVAVIAQKVFRRVGVLWFLMTGALNVLLIFLIGKVPEGDPQWVYDPTYRDHGLAAIAVLSAFFSTAIMLVVLWTLPKKAS